VSLPPLVIDLFSGTGSATRAFEEAGWQVVRVELDERFPADHRDVLDFTWTGRRPTLVWASPPCTEFARESMPWCRPGATPSLDLVIAAERIIADLKPDYWVIENVRGASRYITPRHGRPLVLGPVFLWGRFPAFRAVVRPWKERLSSKQKAERAAIPYAISRGLLEVIESDLFFRHLGVAA
jgi:site-specific DNA-cytosine methylase